MIRRLLVALVTSMIALTAITLVPAASVAAQDIDEEVPPGNPVVGDDRPGDIEPENDTRYGLWAIVAVCLIVAGTLLVRIERWEAKRRPEADE